MTRTQELRNNYQFKFEENVKLVENLQQKEVEIIAYKEKVAALEKKMEVFGQF